MEKPPTNHYRKMDQTDLLDTLQRASLQYFLDQANPTNGLVADSTWQGSPCSIAAVGFALACYPVAVERGWMSRADALDRTLVTLRFFMSSAQGPGPDDTGYQGFYYHFLDLQTGLRVWKCELSTIDTAILLSGMLVAAQYFNQKSAGETEANQLVERLNQRVDWNWAQNMQLTVTHGWKPETGFLPFRWAGYDEALLMYILGLGSVTSPLPGESYRAYTGNFQWKSLYGYTFLYAGPLFIHHFPHIWMDLRGLQDDITRAAGIDYFENTRRATYAHQQYAIQNPRQFSGYNEFGWGITASEGPAKDAPQTIDNRTFYNYLARGIPEPDDGTLSPWTVITSLPFAPEIALPSIHNYHQTYPQLIGQYGMMCSMNPSYPGLSPESPGWFSGNYYGINEGPVVLMIENYRTGLIWQLMRACPTIHHGLHRAGFRGGWLDNAGR